MARLIESLAVSGSRKSDGTVNASGFVFLYEPGTTSRVFGYTSDDLSEAWTTTDGGIPLDSAGKADIWINDPVDVVVQDSDGATVSTFLGFNKVRAEQVEVENDGYTGALTDSAGAVTQALGGKTFLDTLLTRAFTSMGPDFQVKESSGATPVNIVDFLREVWISVTQFDADPTGITDSTEAIQSAINRVKARGGGVVYLPPGTYKTSSVLTLASGTGVKILGAGPGVSTIASSSTSANGLTLSSCTSCTVENLTVYSTSTTSGTSITISSGNTILVNNVAAGNAVIGIDVTGSFITLRDCLLSSISGASGRGIRSAAAGAFISGGQTIAGSGAAIEFTGAAARTTVVGVDFGSVIPSSPTGILFNSSLTGSKFDIIGCPSLGAQTTPIDVTGVTVWPAIRQWGNGIAGSATSTATGAAVAPVLMVGQEITLTATGGAGTVTVNAPSVLPSGTDANGLYYDFVFKNSAGGAVTWTTNAIFVLVGAVAIPSTDAHTICVRFRWDPATSELRECYRGDTVT